MFAWACWSPSATLSESLLAKASVSGSVRRWGQASAMGSVSRLVKGTESWWATVSVPRPRSRRVPRWALMWAPRAQRLARVKRPRSGMVGSQRDWCSALRTATRSELRCRTLARCREGCHG